MACSTGRKAKSSSSTFGGLSGDDQAEQEERLRAADVAAQAGCNLRQLRTLIEEGVVSKAQGAGRGAWYSAEHVIEAKTALAALKRAGFTHPKLKYVTDYELPRNYWLDAYALRRALKRDQSTSIEPIRLELTCGLQLVISRNQPVEYKAAQRAVLSAIADVLERERARVLRLRSSLDASRNASPFNHLAVPSSDLSD